MITINGDDHSIGDLFMDGESTVEGDNIIAGKGGVLETVSTLAAQIKGLIAVNTQENPDDDGRADRFQRDQFRRSGRPSTRPSTTSSGTATAFCDTDDEADTAYDHIEALPGTMLPDSSAAAVEDMVETLDAIVAALSERGRIRGRGSRGRNLRGRVPPAGPTPPSVARPPPAAFNAIAFDRDRVHGADGEHALRRLLEEESTDTADVKLASDSMGAYAYSPMTAAKFADLPQAGAAEYNGRTMAMSMDGKTVYNGDISLQVRFRGKRVSGLVENLLDGDGNLFEYGFGKVAAIILAEATIDSDGHFTEGCGEGRPDRLHGGAGQPAGHSARGPHRA